MGAVYMLTTKTTAPMTEQKFFEREVRLWGFDAIEGLLAQGWFIELNADNEPEWVKDLTDGRVSARLRATG
jgi:hypothetical protein